MKIAFVSIALNIHQVGVADELHRLCGQDFWFIETKEIGDDQSKGGSNDEFAKRSYLIRTANGQTSVNAALHIIREADVMIYGAAPIMYLKERVKTGKLTFVNSERWLKKGLLNLLSLNLLRQQLFYHMHCHNKPVYALCSSAYAVGDFSKLFSFRNKCFKWGYFTAVPEIDIENVQKTKRGASAVKILWVARFLQLKHPERMLQLASCMLASDVDFSIDMIGVGPEYDKIAAGIKIMGLEENVHLLGQMPNSEVMVKMRSYDIFCFTSDKNEGWGAVLNEAMACGCCPVSSIDAGSTPYLVKDGVNGFSFELKKENDLFEKVMWLVKHPDDRERMSVEAYKTVRDNWSPKNAAANLVKLSECLINGDKITITDGPGSVASIV